MARLITQTRIEGGDAPRYKVWHTYNSPGNFDYYAVNSPEEARTLIAELVQKDLRNPNITINAFGLLELEANGYHEWYDEEGNDINHGVED